MTLRHLRAEISIARELDGPPEALRILAGITQAAAEIEQQ